MKPKRRRLRFSLQTLLLVLAWSCVLLAWYLQRVEQQRAAVQWVVGNGGTVYYDHVVQGWLLNLLSVDHFATVTRVDCSFQNRTMPPALKFASLNAVDITPLAGLTSLEQLSLHGLRYTDTKALSGLTSLKSLSLSNYSNIMPLTDLTNLEKLHIYNPSRGAARDFKELRQALPNCKITFGR